MRLTNFLLGACALGLAVGCAPSNPGMVAEGILTLDSMCTVTTTNALLLEGTLDVSTDAPAALRPNGIRYAVAVRVGNQLINNANRIYPLMADPNRIIFDHMEVTLLDSAEATLSLAGLPNPYLVPADGSAASTVSMDPTFGIASATVIPDSYGQSLAANFPTGGPMVVRIRVIGTTAGGATLTSGPISFPLNLCVGCLFACGVDAMGAPVNAPSCLPGQDAVSLRACP